jgi:hypothetical protein
MVSAIRISANAEIEPVRTVERNGKAYEQNTANIGRAKPDAAPAFERASDSPSDSSEVESDSTHTPKPAAAAPTVTRAPAAPPAAVPQATIEPANWRNACPPAWPVTDSVTVTEAVTPEPTAHCGPACGWRQRVAHACGTRHRGLLLALVDQVTNAREGS